MITVQEKKKLVNLVKLSLTQSKDDNRFETIEVIKT